MVKKNKKNENREKLSAQDYRKRAAEHLRILKSSWGLFGRTGVFMVLSLLVVICMAWFVNNDSVQVEDLTVRSAGSDFELAVKGGPGRWDEKLSPVSYGEVQKIDEVEYYVTGKNSTILWSLEDSSNLDNQQNIGKGISPGSAGSLTFYILPQKTGSLSIPFQLRIEGMTREDKEVSKADLELLRGHVLFFAGYDNAKQSYSGWISKDADPWTIQLENGISLSYDVEGNFMWQGEAEEGKAYPVTIYWIWPEVFGEYIFKEKGHWGNKPVLFPEDFQEENGNPATLPAKLFEKICGVPEGKVSNGYLMWAKESDTEQEKVQKIEQFRQLVKKETLESMRSLKGYNIITYSKVCNYYDNADQYLGENIGFLFLRLNTK